MHDSAYAEARRTAIRLRLVGYPDATAERDYCIDGQIGPDRYYTRTVSVFVGEYRPAARLSALRRVFRLIVNRLA